MLEREDDGCFGVFVAGIGPGVRYAYRLDGGDPIPDPVSRFQPDGPHGRSLVVDPAFDWTDGGWPGPAATRQILYEFRTEWGEALNFDGPGSDAVREHVLANVAYWIDEFHMDGLRLDATQSIFDDGPAPIVREIGRTTRAAAGGRRVFVSGENEPQDPVLLRPETDGGCALDALWNDDFHHSARVALTGRDEAYYTDYTGSPQELVSAVTRGWLFQGQRYSWQDQRRGSPAPDIAPRQLVNYLQNHDQVANSLRGERLHTETDAASLRALTALLLLGPSHVLLFQGQEYGAPQPFLYFADHGGELGEAVRSGRHEFLRQFESIAVQGADAVLDDPRLPATFERCRLDPADRARGAHWLALHRDLIRLSRDDDVIAEARAPDGAVIGANALALRWRAPHGGRLLIVNLGGRLLRRSIAEPLLAAPRGAAWQIGWSSEDPRYGGRGTPDVETTQGWNVPARAAVLLVPGPDAGRGHTADRHA